MLVVLVETRQAGREKVQAGLVGRIKTHHLHLEQGEEMFTPCQRSQGPGGCHYGAGLSRVNAGQGWRRLMDRRGQESSVGQARCFDGGQLKKLPLNQALVESRVAGGVPLKILGVINRGELSPPYLCVVPSPPRLSRCCRDVSRAVWK